MYNEVWSTSEIGLTIHLQIIYHVDFPTLRETILHYNTLTIHHHWMYLLPDVLCSEVLAATTGCIRGDQLREDHQHTGAVVGALTGGR